MVLSNKKLKNKLRAVLAESLAGNDAVKPLQNEQRKVKAPKDGQRAEENVSLKCQSLRELLGSATQKPRLSKREKRRNKMSLEDSKPSELNGDAQKEIDCLGSNKKNNKRKRNDDGGGVTESKETKKKKKKKKETKRGNNDENGKANEPKSGESKEEGVEKLEKINERKRKDDGDKGGDGAGVVESKKKKKKKKKKKETKKENKKNNDGNGKANEPKSGESKEEGVAKLEKINESQENRDTATKVYVGGIPYYSTEDDIRSFFEGCGTIVEVDCMRFPETGKFRGIAMITFKTEAAATRALALDGADMGGLFLKIQPYKNTRAHKPSDFAPKIVDGYNRIYVGNLSWDISEDELRKFFSDCNISSIRFGEDKTTGEFRGYAHVDFSDALSLAMALTLDQKVVCGRPVRIRCAVPKKETKPSSEFSTKKRESSGSFGSEKKKRRTCYECGVPGHISSSCPKKQVGKPLNSGVKG
eukprot:TRINITY_DN732_c1_g1_i1.p1 TRINITY_DN732_c1_g1~~TRINITY_DN732_c1_g1_i1.p1  ORF type:complete len:473 (-),score=134.96 TRINITY_DN732_c1_g1_i1:219-1637(-)